jgi:hypothetical protein
VVERTLAWLNRNRRLAKWPKTLRLRSPVPRLGSTLLASNSSLGDWRVVKTTYTIKIQTLR